jgi:hypothetical protein
MAAVAPVKYSYAGPPFHWLGNFALSQWQSFQKWVNNRTGDVAAISTFHRIRAEQLRKTAGVLEQYYSTVYPEDPASHDQSLAPTFKKPIWQPGQYGHFNYSVANDHLPMVMVSRIKKGVQPALERESDAVYYMNQVRCLIEKNEDAAQFSNDFLQDPPADSSGSNPRTLTELLTKINTYFNKPEYQTTLIDDVNAGNMYKGQPYGRTSQADDMTQWELEQANHGQPDDPINIVDTESIDPTTTTVT